MSTRTSSLCIPVVLAIAALEAHEQPRQTFRASTRLVTIDAIVQGNNGEPNRDLTAADCTLTEDGRPQRIELFSMIAAQPQGGAAAPPDPNVFTNRPGGRAPSTATVILFDRLNTRFEDQVAARNEIV